MTEEETHEYPSIDLAYERSRKALDNQLTISNVLESKASMLWVTATAVIGIGGSLGLQAEDPFSRAFTWLPWLALGAFLTSTALTFKVVFPSRSINLLTNLETFRCTFWSAPRDEFLIEISTHMESAWKSNGRQLTIEGWTVRAIYILVLIEVLSLLGWVGLLHGEVVG